MDVTERNYRNVPFGQLRQTFDPAYIESLAALTEAYYGPLDENGRRVPGTGWRNGQSSPWNGHDKLATVAESKALFEQLHADLLAAYESAFWDEVQKKKNQLPAEDRARIPADTPPIVVMAKARLDALPADRRAKVEAAIAAGLQRANERAAGRGGQ